MIKLKPVVICDGCNRLGAAGDTDVQARAAAAESDGFSRHGVRDLCRECTARQAKQHSTVRDRLILVTRAVLDIAQTPEAVALGGVALCESLAALAGAARDVEIDLTGESITGSIDPVTP